MDPSAKSCESLSSSVPLFDAARLPLRSWCSGSREDPLTGLIAFPDFHSHLPRELAATLTGGGLVALAIGDVDGLKEHVESANATDPDCYGHLAGNRVMARLGATTRDWFHEQSWAAGCAATFGGDEVIVAAAIDDPAAFHRAIGDLRDRLAAVLPTPVSFALTITGGAHLPAQTDGNGWKHAFTDRLLGAAFHWMDRDQVLRDLDQLIAPGGAVVLASGGAPGDVDPAPWLAVIAEVRTRYLGPDRRAGSGTYAHPKERHQEVLARSPFSHVETARWDRTLTRTLDEVVGLQFSYSYSSPAQLGPDKDAFEADLREALTAFSPEGRFDELIRTEAIIATRP